jgi:hypothetical protein
MKNIILNHLVHIGDRVVMNMNSEARSCGRKGVPDGTVGTVVGVYRYKQYRSRFGLDIHFEPFVQTDYLSPAELEIFAF